MVKKLQALKAKKGFTLVELIVVIAIIGVLAAILVPTLLGVVTKSRVTSADSTASSIKTQVDNFLTQADADGYGMIAKSTNMIAFEISVTSSGSTSTWTVTASGAGGMFNKRATNSGEVAWASNATTTVGASRTSSADPTKLLAQALADAFPDMKRASMIAYVQGGKNCVLVAYTADTSAIADFKAAVAADKLITLSSYAVARTSEWNGHNAGISANGFTVGTAPKVDIV